MVIQNGPGEISQPEEPTEAVQALPVDDPQGRPDWLITPHCSCGRELELMVEVQGIHDAKAESCHGTMSLVFCKECGQVIRSLFDPYHTGCDLKKQDYAPEQLMR